MIAGPRNHRSRIVGCHRGRADLDAGTQVPGLSCPRCVSIAKKGPGYPTCTHLVWTRMDPIRTPIWTLNRPCMDPEITLLRVQQRDAGRSSTALHRFRSRASLGAGDRKSRSIPPEGLEVASPHTGPAVTICRRRKMEHTAGWPAPHSRRDRDWRATTEHELPDYFLNTLSSRSTASSTLEAS
jgi:hypothetical protein